MAPTSAEEKTIHKFHEAELAYCCPSCDFVDSPEGSPSSAVVTHRGLGMAGVTLDFWNLCGIGNIPILHVCFS